MKHFMKNDHVNETSTEWASLSYEKKNELLLLRQREILDMFLARGAISKEQHDKSLHDLIEKMSVAVGGSVK